MENKLGVVTKGVTVGDEDLAKINELSLRGLAAEEVFAFRVAACDTRVDRDLERFSAEALEEMAGAYVGKTVIFDHIWSGKGQTARVYAGEVQDDGDGEKVLILSAYMLKNEATQPVVDAIEGGILKEVSVGLACKRQVCSICGKDARACEHKKGLTYAGERCVHILSGVVDVYELSFVAVPAQPRAGVRKSYRAENEGVNLLRARIARARIKTFEKNMEVRNDKSNA